MVDGREAPSLIRESRNGLDTSRRATRTLGNLIQNIELSESKIRSLALLERRSRRVLRNPWTETPSSHLRRQQLHGAHIYDICMYNRSRVISACITPGRESFHCGALKNKSYRRDGNGGGGDSGRLSIHRALCNIFRRYRDRERRGPNGKE